MRQLISLMLLCGIVLLPASLVAKEKPTPHEATHKQVRKIAPKRDGKSVKLNTFALDADGNVLACVANATGQTKDDDAASWLQVYSPEGKLLRETALPFNATAVNQAPSGIVFVAGNGQVSKLDSKGKILATIDAPHLGDKEALKKQAEIDAKEQMEQVTSMYRTQLERVEGMIEDIEEKEEQSDRDKKRLVSLEAQRDMFAKQQKQMEESYADYFSVEAMLANAMRITSLAVNSKDVFLCCNSGMGYDVWRMDHDFSAPSKVVTGLSGCCGQCDIQANDENLVLAENTKFKVSLLDRDGERLTSFGERAGSADEGFGSCCNPMNVRCCSNGDILTAESSIGTIKRFNKEGEYLGTVGKAKIGGGCKHVALGFDEKRDRYYIQYEDKNQICVMWPLSEAPEFTEEELAAKEAMDGLGKKLIGDGKKLSGEWSMTGSRPKASSGNSVFALIGAALGGSEDSDDDAAASGEVVMDGTVSYFKFLPGGKLEIRGGYSEDGDNGWAAVSQDMDSKTLVISQLDGGIQYYDYKITFIDDYSAKFTMMYGDQEMSSNFFSRIPVKEEADATAEVEEVAEQKGDEE